MKNSYCHFRLARRRFFLVSWALVIAAATLVSQADSQGDENVPRPQGLIVKTTTSHKGNILELEWQPPYCVVKEIVDVAANEYTNNNGYVFSYDAQKIVYDESPAYDFEVSLSTVDPWSLQTTWSEVGELGVTEYCETPFSKKDNAFPHIIHANNWLHQGSERRKIKARFENLEPWVEYNVEVKSIVKVQSTWQNNPPSVGSKSSKSATLQTTLATTAVGSGEEQARKSGIEESHGAFQLHSCSDSPLFNYCYNTDWNVRYLAEPPTQKVISGDFLGLGKGQEDIILLNFGKPNQFLAQSAVLLLQDTTFSVGMGGWYSAGDLTASTWQGTNSLNAVVLDANMDGKLDVYITNDNDDKNVLLLNQRPDIEEGGSVYDSISSTLTSLFEADDSTQATLQTSSDHSSAAITMDCNGDSAPDLFVVNGNAVNKLFVNSASNPGAFTRKTSGAPTLNQNIWSNDAVAFDCRNDGSICIYVVNSGNHDDELWIEDGSNTCNFVRISGGQATANKVDGQNSVSVLAADLNGDGALDLYVSTFENQNKLFINELIGHQAEYAADNTYVYFSQAPILADGGVMNNAVRRLTQTKDAVAVDIDGDGDLDLALADGQDGPTILINDGSGVFSHMNEGFMKEFAGYYTTGGDTETGASSGVAAVQGGHRDGIPILIFAQARRNIVILPITGKSMYSGDREHISFERVIGNDASATTMDTHFTLAFDFNGDKYMDMLVLNRNEMNQILINDGTGSFTLWQETTLNSASLVAESDNTNPKHALYQDFNGDGHKDIFIVNYKGQNEFYLCDPNQPGTPSGWTKVTTGDQSQLSDRSVYALAHDFNGDGHLDIYVANSLESNELLLNSGTGHFTRATNVGQLNSGGLQNTLTATAADFDGDGAIDIFECPYVPSASAFLCKLLINDGTGSFTWVQLTGEEGRVRELDFISQESDTIFQVAASDVDLDGIPDLLVLTLSQLYVLFNKGDAHFTATRVFSYNHVYWEDPGKTYTGFTLFDANSDGADDIALFQDGHKYILFNDGNGNFLEALIYDPEKISQRTGDQTRNLLAADFDMDGDIDLYASNYGSTNELLLNCGSGFSMLQSSKYCVPAPRLPFLESVTPEVGITQGGEIAVIRGNLGADPYGQVTIGGKNCDIFVYSSTSTWLCITPPGVIPAGNVIINNFGRVSLAPETPKFEYGQVAINHVSPKKFFQGTPGGFCEDLSPWYCFAPENYIKGVDWDDQAGGGVTFTIEGENFGTDPDQLRVQLCDFTSTNALKGYFDTDWEYFNQLQEVAQQAIQDNDGPVGSKCYDCENLSLTTHLGQDDTVTDSRNRIVCSVTDESIFQTPDMFNIRVQVLSGAVGWYDNPNRDLMDFGTEDKYQVCIETVTVLIEGTLQGNGGQTASLESKCTCQPGREASLSNGWCKKCDFDMYSEDGVTCTSCPPGSFYSSFHTENYEPNPFATSVADCTCPEHSTMNVEEKVCECHAGYSGDSTSSGTCTACGQFAFKGSVGNHQCTPCPLGAQIPNDGITIPATGAQFCVCGAHAELNSDTNRCECSAGYGGDATSFSVGCSPCGSNAFKESLGNDQCTSCPSGSSISGGETTATSSDSCVCGSNAELNTDAGRCECSAGYGGDATGNGCSQCGSSAFKISVGNDQCTACPSGSSIPGGETTATSSDSCVCGSNAEFNSDTNRCECSAGYGGDATVSSIGCTACGSNAYKGAAGNTQCTACPSGSSISGGETTATSSDSCVCGSNAELNTDADRCECSAGYGGDTTGNGCSQCGSSAFKISVGNDQCTACPPGSSISGGETTATSSDSCVCGSNAEFNSDTNRCECSAGYGGDATVVSIGCTACGSNAYKGASGNTQCTACPSGSSISGGETTATSSDSCVCGSNAEFNSDAGRCECSAGYGGDATGTGCSQCGNSAFKESLGNNQCTACPPGSSISGGETTATSSDSCVCGSNAELNSDADRCECSAGYGGDATGTGCSQCGNSAFKESLGNNQCTACPPGSSISGGETTATSSDSCVCGSNAELNSDADRCECSAGYGGDATGNGCSQCGNSAFKGSAGNDQCTACPSGSSISGGETTATSSDSCVCGSNAEFNSDTNRCECSAGYGGDATVSSIGCTACGSSAFKGSVGNDQCTACPLGSSISGGETTATSSDSCVCGGNAELNSDSGRCECSAGYGGDATSFSVGCSACGTRAYKTTKGNIGCTECPPGSIIENEVITATDPDSCTCGVNTVYNTESDRCECAEGYGGDATVAGVGCSVCGSAAFKGDIGNTQCTSCPSGSSISDGVTTATSSDSCVCGSNAELNVEMNRCECSEGYGGDATDNGCSQCGSSAFKGSLGNNQCTACPSGSSISDGETTATSSDSCVCGSNAELNSDADRCECSAGYGGDATGNGCSQCGSSAFKASLGNYQCTACPPGSSISDGETTATSSDSCVCGSNAEMNSDTGRCECSAGYGGDATGNGCSVCGSIAFKASLGNYQCTACPSGSSISGGETTATSSDSCVCGSNAEMNSDTGRCECSAGYGGDATGSGCSACGNSAFKIDVGNNQCTWCPSGSSISGGETTATSSDSCVCGGNAEMNSDTGRCECSAGYGGDATVSSIGCSPCGASSHKEDVGNTGCTPCALGAGISGGVSNATDPDSCECPIRSLLNVESHICECLSGHGGDATNSNVGCSVCGTGAYKGAAGNTQCTACPLGSSISGGETTATSSDSCVCGSNAEMNSDTGRCECSAGYGGDASNSNVGCSVCGTGAYKGAAGNTQCTACPSGSSISGGETTATSSDSCVCGGNAEMNSDTGRCECSAGYGGDATVVSIGCSPCGASSHKEDVGNTGCTPCALGAGISGGVSNATDPDSCECPIRSLLNVESHICECLSGHGGDATNSNVGCSVCGTGAYKGAAGNTQCTACPSGSSISGGETTATSSDSCVCGGNAEMNSDTGRCECSAGYGGDATVVNIGCSPCGASSHKEDVGNTGCTPCALGAGISGGVSNATDPDSCECPIRSLLNVESHICECLSGHGGDATNSNVGCSVCGTGAYKGAAGNTQCTACPLGSSISGGETTATSSDSCVCGSNAEMNSDTGRCECSAGYGGDATSLSIGCTACGTGAFKANAGNTQCTACPSGSSISGGETTATSSDSCVCGSNAEMNSDTGRCECSAGYGGDATSLSIGCTACGTGAFKANAGNTQCTACPSGSSISGGETTATSSDSCVCGSNAEMNSDTGRCECSAGYGGDATGSGCTACGSSAFKASVGNDQCTACPLGSLTSNDEITATSSDSCVCGAHAELNSDTGRCECSAGYGGDATSFSVGCSPCGSDAFKGLLGNDQCTACPLGAIILDGVNNATTSNECSCPRKALLNEETQVCECAAGYGGDATAPNIGCSVCGSSTYKGGVGNTGCTPCPSGSFIGGGVTNATSPSSCLCGVNAEMNDDTGRCECAAGYGGDATAPNIGCSVCGSSTYKGDAGNTGCTPCPSGSFIGGGVTNATSPSSCLCGVNAEMNDDTGRCECAAGYGGDATNSNIGCSVCGSSAYKGGVGNTGCTPCPSGSFIGGGVTNATSPSSCLCGVNAEMNDDTGRCECAAGYGGDATAPNIGCSMCGSSAYKGDAGNTGCTPCPSGSFIGVGVTNATSPSSCLCGVNAEMNDDTGRCECAAGYGGDATNSNIGCSVCGSSAYKGGVGNTGCTPCPSGSFIGGGVTNATSPSSCLCGVNAEMNDDTGRCECAAGYGGDATVSNIGCSECGSSAYKGGVGNTGCTPCPSGSSIGVGLTNATSSDSCACGVNAILNAESEFCECEAGYGGDATKRDIGCSACGSRAYKAMSGNSGCDPCPLGSTIQNGATATSIEECFCDEGTVVVGSSNSSISCQCGLGYFGSNTGQGSCELCPLGEYKDVVGDAVSCKSCSVAIGEGAVTLQQGSEALSDCECGYGFYMSGGVCMPCEIGAHCPGGDVSSMVALPGYWRSDPVSSVFFSCDSPNGLNLCMGGDLNQTGGGSFGPRCRDGHEGHLCAKCIKGYGKTYGICSKCNSSFNASSYILVLFAVCAFLALLYLLISNNLRKATAQQSSKDSITLSVVKIVINWLQMASIAAQVRVSSNKSMERFYQVQDVSNVSPFQFSSFNCMVQGNYYTQFYSSLFIPPACIVLGFCLTGMHFVRGKARAKGVRFRDMFVMVCQMLWFFTYSMISQIILGIFECRDLDRGLSVLSADLSIQCETSRHSSAVKLGVIFGLLYIVGIPLQVLAQLYWYRADLGEKSVKVRYMFLFHNYRKGLYWYECINMLRKIGLVAALVLLQEDLGTQVFTLSVISMTYLTLHAYIKPYSSRTLNELETMSLFVTALTLSMCSFFYSNPTGTGNAIVENGLTWCVIALSISLLMWSLFLISKTFLLTVTRGKMRSGDNFSDLPSTTSRQYLQNESPDDCVGSPSQFKSLLSHDELGAPDTPSPVPSKQKMTLVSNPLAETQKQKQKQVKQEEMSQLPSTLSKEWLKMRNLVSDAHSQKRGLISRNSQVTNPLSEGQEDDQSSNEDSPLLPETLTNKSTPTEEVSTDLNNSSISISNPLSKMGQENNKSDRDDSTPALPKTLVQSTPARSLRSSSNTPGTSSVRIANPLAGLSQKGKSDSGQEATPRASSPLPPKINVQIPSPGTPSRKSQVTWKNPIFPEGTEKKG